MKKQKQHTETKDYIYKLSSGVDYEGESLIGLFIKKSKAVKIARKIAKAKSNEYERWEEVKRCKEWRDDCYYMIITKVQINEVSSLYRGYL